MRPSLLPSALATLYDIRQPFFLEGPPGVGKSSICKQFAASKNIGVITKRSKELKESFGLIDRRASLMDPMETGGFPYVNVQKKKAEYLPFDWLPTSGSGIILFDEFNLAPVMIMNSLLQLIHDRRLHDYELPPGWMCGAAGNRVQDRAGSNRMTSQLRNRFVWISLEVNHADWVKHALENDFAWEVVYYNRWRPEALYQFDPTKDENAFATLRSWEFVSNIIKANPDPSVRFDLLVGSIGRAQATEFEGFCKIAHELPDPKKILKNPDNEKFPTDPAAQVALCGALSRLCKEDESLIDPIARFASRLKKEFAVLLIKDCETQNPKVFSQDGYVKWIGHNSWYSGLAKAA
jgi:hypothetical protein